MQTKNIITAAVLIWTMFFSFVLIFSPNVKAQHIDWLTIHANQSHMTSTSQLNEGANYTVNKYAGGQQIVSHCDEQGVVLFQKEVCSCRGWINGQYTGLNIMYTSVLPNGHHYHFMSNGHIIESDMELDTIRNFELFTAQTKVLQIEQFGDNILITIIDTTTSQILMNPKTLNVLNSHSIGPQVYYSSGGDVGMSLSILAYYFGNSTLRLFHKDTSGSILLDKELILDESNVTDVLIGANNQYYVVGWKNNEEINHGGITRNGFLLALTSSGVVTWRRDFLADSSIHFLNFNLTSHVAQLSDESLIVVGQKGFSPIGPIAKLFIAKVHSNGQLAWELEEDIYAEGTEINKLFTDDHDQLIVTGTTGISDHPAPERAFLLQVSELVGHSDLVHKVQKVRLYPNPTSDILSIKSLINDKISNITIFDISGREVLRQTNNCNIQIDVSALCSGVYFIHFVGGNWSANERFVKL